MFALNCCWVESAVRPPRGAARGLRIFCATWFLGPAVGSGAAAYAAAGNNAAPLVPAQGIVRPRTSAGLQPLRVLPQRRQTHRRTRRCCRLDPSSTRAAITVNSTRSTRVTCLKAPPVPRSSILRQDSLEYRRRPSRRHPRRRRPTLPPQRHWRSSRLSMIWRYTTVFCGSRRPD